MREDARGCAEETGGGSDSPAGRGGPGRAGEGRGRRRWGRGPGRGRGGAGAGLAEPGSPGPRPPDAPTMSWFRAALRATRPVRSWSGSGSGSGSAGRLGGAAGAAASGYGAPGGQGAQGGGAGRSGARRPVGGLGRALGAGRALGGRRGPGRMGMGVGGRGPKRSCLNGSCDAWAESAGVGAAWTPLPPPNPLGFRVNSAASPVAEDPRRCTGQTSREALAVRWSLCRMGNSTSSSASAPAPVNQIQETISDNCVVIFSKTSCSYCTMAKKLFHDMNVKYKVVELDMLEYGSQFQDALYKMTGERTVPRIFINGTFIGGATDTHRLHKEGKLLPLVHQCYLKKSKRKEF
uniref:Glutaredoxin-2, mitochondrial n=1 Tax=Canis lupus familiaris TaxID=9615 RepID=A0A8C0S942_CANLF